MAEYQPPPNDQRLAIFAGAATTFFNSIDGFLQERCAHYGQFPTLSPDNLKELAIAAEARRKIVYDAFLGELRTKARVASPIINGDPQLLEVLGPAPHVVKVKDPRTQKEKDEPRGSQLAYIAQAGREAESELRLRVLKEGVIEAPQTANPYVSFWKVTEGYADAYNARNPQSPLHTRLKPTGQFYTHHFNDRSKDAQELEFFGLLPLMDREIRQSTTVDITHVHAKAYMLLGRQLMKGIDALISKDQASAKSRLTVIRRGAIERLSKSERFTRVFNTGQYQVQKLLLESSALGDE